MNQEDIIRMAHETGIIPWCQMHWSANQFVTIDEGMDGDLTCLMQFAALVAAAEREACAKVCDDYSEFRWSWWKARADPLDQGASDAADELAQRIRSRK